MERIFIGARELLLDSYRLALAVHRGGFRPTFVAGLWPDGAAVGIAVQECLDRLGVKTDHGCVGAARSGPGDDPRTLPDPGGVEVPGFGHLGERLRADDSLLLVDAAWGSGAVVAAVLRGLRERLGERFPRQARTASVWYRPTPRGARPPDFFVRETAGRIVMPHELAGLDADEIEARRPGLREILHGLRGVPEAARLFGER